MRRKTKSIIVIIKNNYLRLKRNPNSAPDNPPTIWVNWEMLSDVVKPEYISCPNHNMATRIKVIGIPSSFPVIEAKRINANTTPLDPSNITSGWTRLWNNPVTTAVTTITMISLSWYFSSRIGPSNKRYRQLDTRWAKSLWPKQWPTNLTYVKGFNHDDLYVEKNNSVDAPFVTLSRTMVIKHIITNSKVIGAFK